MLGRLVFVLTLCSTIAVAQNYEYNNQPSLAQIGVTRAMHASVNGTGVSVAVLDTWAFNGNSDLIGKTIWAQVYVATTRGAHGTWTASLAAARADDKGIVGVAPGSPIYNIPMLDSQARTLSNWDGGTRALNRLRTLNANGANIRAVNMSYATAGPNPFSARELIVIDGYSDFLLVHGAGNSGRTYKTMPIYYPYNAAVLLNDILLVGAVDQNNVITEYSNRPGEACIARTQSCAENQKTKYFFVVAPGNNLMGATGNTTWWEGNGTSGSAPLVTGAAALIFAAAEAKGFELTAAAVADILKQTATDLGAPGVDGVYGWGLINVERALEMLNEMS